MVNSNNIEKILYMGVGRSGLDNEARIIAKALSELMEYRTIGIVEEFKDLKEKETEILLKDGQLLYQQGLVDGYAKAINDFAEKLKEKSTFLKSLENDYYGYVSEEEIDEVAELMRGNK